MVCIHMYQIYASISIIQMEVCSLLSTKVYLEKLYIKEFIDCIHNVSDKCQNTE